MRLLLREGCWVVHIPIVRMVRFKVLAQFPVDQLGHCYGDLPTRERTLPPQYKYKHYFSPSTGLGHISAGFVGIWICIGVSWFWWPSVMAVRHGFQDRHPRASGFRGIPTGSDAFLESPGVSGLQLCYRTIINIALCYTRSIGGTIDKYRLSPSSQNCTNILILYVCSSFLIIFTQPLRSGRIWHKVNF